MASIDDLAREITNAVRDYTEDVTHAIESKVDETAERMKRDTQAEAPKKTGKYAKGFKVTKRDKQGSVKRIIWNKKYSRLVHLLEFGHAKVNGGRVQGHPHLRPVYDRHARQLTDDIKRIIRNGGGQ